MRTLPVIGLFVLGLGKVMAEPELLGEGCGDPFRNGEVGPYDYEYSYDRKQNIPVIDLYHFNSDVENLVRGQSSAYIMGDLDYVLRAVPNHHRALASLLRYAPRRLPQEKKFFSTGCYFQRAVAFRPNDATAHLLFGVYLANNENTPEAKNKYLAALKLQPDHVEAHYNLGLLYVKEKEFDLAVDSAKKAYALGFPLQGLKRQLQKVGAWTDD